MTEKQNLHRGPSDSQASGQVTSPRGHFPNSKLQAGPEGLEEGGFHGACGFPWGPPHPSIS